MGSLSFLELICLIILIVTFLYFKTAITGLSMWQVVWTCIIPADACPDDMTFAHKTQPSRILAWLTEQPFPWRLADKCVLNAMLHKTRFKNWSDFSCIQKNASGPKKKFWTFMKVSRVRWHAWYNKSKCGYLISIDCLATVLLLWCTSHVYDAARCAQLSGTSQG